MGKLNCFFVRLGKKKKNKVDVESSRAGEFAKRIARLHINIEQPVTPFETDELKLTSFSVPVPYDMQDNSFCNAKVMSHESPVGDEPAEIAYEGEDEHEENLSIKREFSDFDLQAHVTNSGEEEFNPSNRNSGCFDSIDAAVNGQFENQAEKGHEKGVDIIRSGHVSDPGIGKAEFWASPELKRSCSNLETSVVLRKIADQLPPSKSESYNELQELASKLRQNFDPGSPGSVKSHLSADRVMLKKRSSSQILPSRSRRLWWKLFLWSHRNLHKPWISRPQPIPTVAALKQSGGYSSDTLEPNKGMNSGKILSPGSYTDESLNKDWSGNYNNGNSNLDGFDNGISAVWPHNQWFAFQPEPASFKRVDEWVKDLETLTPIPVVDNEVSDEGIVFPPPSLDTGKSPARITAHSTYRTDINLSAEILHANSVIQSLNPSSTVAHIANIGLKAIPTISRFSGLRTVNLSNNFIVHITGGSLPKGLQILNLSRNKITTIEGLRELTRLRVLDLSYNRISRIGHGLSSCTIIKELYLAGNKISDIEGLHRLLKLTVLDMSFNKITTTKALGQLVANYNSLLALNLLGNPIQSNISDDQLRKAVCSLLPKLVYLNKQPIKPQRARELLNDSVAKAVLGSSSKSTRRKAGKRSSRSETFPSAQRSGVTVGQKNKGKLKSQSNSHSPLKTLSSAHASS